MEERQKSLEDLFLELTGKGGEPVKLLALEFCKCRRHKLTLVCAGLLAAQLLWFGAYLTRQDAEALAQGWMLLLYNLAMVDAIMLPIGVAVIASRSCELEHRGHTLKLLETAVTPGRLYAAKLAWGALVLAGLPGARRPLSGPGPCHGLPPAGAPLGAVRGFYRPVLGGVHDPLRPPAGAVPPLRQPGRGSGMRHLRQLRGTHGPALPVWVQRCVPLGVLRPALLVRMEWDEATRWTAFFWRRPEPLDLALLCLWAALFLTVGRTLFVRKEV